MDYMFNGCSDLTNLDIRKMDFSKVTSYSSMLAGIKSDCKIIASSDGKTWINTNFSNLTNVVLPS